MSDRISRAAAAVNAPVKLLSQAVRNKRSEKEASAKFRAGKMAEELETILQGTPSVAGDRNYGCSKLEASTLIAGSVVGTWTHTGYLGHATAAAVLSSGVHVCSCGHEKGWGKRIPPPGYHTPTKKSSLSGGSTLLPHGDYIITDHEEENIVKALRDCLDHSNKNSKGKSGRVVLQTAWCCAGCATEYAREHAIRYVVAG
ncbi:hypothetical protein AMAG_17092 [Allomyces macrogynus ATCC 38327]|uniref:Uncharacterized protein n=1 Tax=Allomyces macrogynus (strain ATCC 38327) TaxID=578462 RepID=A0A0L0TDV3_ALLM3|nr:hypothetical protein AMAG_17092 [Allomyces macrogynus ATCC 38327]|eukprot:KNE72764.1 hypothetical protein AMAG_17092 [Allomyces macrogynus ATCC 38327]